MKIVPANKAREKGKERRWPYKVDTCHPVWNKARDLGRFVEGDTLRIALHHHAKGAPSTASTTSRMGKMLGPAMPVVYSQVLGGCDVSLQDVRYGAVIGPLVVNTSLSDAIASKPLPAKNSTHLFLRFLAPPKARKTVFVVRHA
jgi:hypothetical protein